MASRAIPEGREGCENELRFSNESHVVQLGRALTSGVLAITLFVELDEWLPSILGWVEVIEPTCVSAKLLHRTRSEKRVLVIFYTTNAIMRELFQDA